MEHNKNEMGPIEDDTDEFEVISREEDKEILKTFDITYKQPHDEVASTVCDDEGGLDRADDSAVPSRCESLLHSMCSMAPFSTDSSQYEKVLEVVKEESEKNRSVLEQIASMVEQLTKEKSDVSHNPRLAYFQNADLRVKVANYEGHVKMLEDQLMKLNASIEEQEEYSRKQLQSIATELSTSTAGNSQKEEQITALVRTINERDQRILALEREILEKSTNTSELEDVQKALEKQQRECASQSEIIRLLQEEIAEGERLLAKARKDYRDKIDELSEQFFDRNYRGEDPKPTSSKRLNRSSSTDSKSSVFICDRCLTAFPTNGLYRVFFDSPDLKWL